MEHYRANTKRDVLVIESEPHITKSYRGFGLVVVARKENDMSMKYELKLDGIKSLAEGLEPLLKNNQGLFTGLKFGIKKASKERSASYVIDTNFHDQKEVDTVRTQEERLWKQIDARYKYD